MPMRLSDYTNSSGGGSNGDGPSLVSSVIGPTCCSLAGLNTNMPTHTKVQTCTHTLTHARTFTYKDTHMHTLTNMHTYTHAPVHAHAHTLAHAHVHAHASEAIRLSRKPSDVSQKEKEEDN